MSRKQFKVRHLREWYIEVQKRAVNNLFLYNQVLTSICFAIMSSCDSDKVRAHSTMTTFCDLIFSHFDQLALEYFLEQCCYFQVLTYLSLHMKLFTSSLGLFRYFSGEFYDVPQVSIAIPFNFRVWKPSCFGGKKTHVMSGRELALILGLVYIKKKAPGVK